MSMNYNPNATDQPNGSLETGESMFAGVPAWERGAKKKRGFGSARAKPAASTPVVDPVVDPVTAAPLARETRIDPVTNRVDRNEYATMGTMAAADPLVSPTVADEPLMAPPPRTTTRTVRKSGGVSPIALGAGIVVLGGLAAAGWYASQPQDRGVAELAPGEPAAVTSTTTTTTTPAPTQMAANTMAPPAVTAPARASAPAATTSSRTTTSRTTTVRTRPAPAASSSAMDMGVNTSATLPAGPQPYSGAATSTAPAPSAATDMPAAAAPTPTAPAAVNPDPTPVEPNASSSASSPTPATTATPEAATPPVTSPPQ